MKAPKGIVFFGATASNGKSTILNLIRLLLPRTATCSIPPSDFEKEQSLPTLVRKTANLTDEISNYKSIASDKMKSLITGDIVAAKIVYQPVFNFQLIATHIFATSELPSIKGSVDAGVERRMLVMPFTKTIPEEQRITNLKELIADKEASLLVSEAIKTAPRHNKEEYLTFRRHAALLPNNGSKILILYANGMPKRNRTTRGPKTSIA